MSAAGDNTRAIPQKWEIWTARVKYQDTVGEKVRPVLIYDNKTAYFLSFKITSHEPRANFRGEYRIKYWKEAGLHLPSTVRCSEALNLEEADIFSKIGRLDMADIREVRNILRSLYGE